MTPPRQRTAPVEAEVDEDALAERAAAAVREKLIADARATYAGPGIYDWPADAYHADPVPGGSARSTTLRTILKAGGPALVEWERLHPRHSDAFDFGGAAHRYVLGKGDDVVEVPCDSWRTNAAKDARRDARRRGARPLLTAEILKAHALADQVLAHEVAGPLFRSSIPERTAVWDDDETGETCRVMVDAFPNLDLPGRPVAGDLKTTGSVEMRKLIRTILDYGYDQQGAWVLDGLASLGVVDAEFWLVFVTKDPPHLVRTVRLPDELLERGRRRNRRALTRWAFCRDTGTWPALPPVIDDPDVPSWVAYEQEEDQ